MQESSKHADKDSRKLDRPTLFYNHQHFCYNHQHFFYNHHYYFTTPTFFTTDTMLSAAEWETFTPTINELIRSVLLQERAVKKNFWECGQLAVKYKMVN